MVLQRCLFHGNDNDKTSSLFACLFRSSVASTTLQAYPGTVNQSIPKKFAFRALAVAVCGRHARDDDIPYAVCCLSLVAISSTNILSGSTSLYYTYIHRHDTSLIVYVERKWAKPDEWNFPPFCPLQPTKPRQKTLGTYKKLRSERAPTITAHSISQIH